MGAGGRLAALFAPAALLATLRALRADTAALTDTEGAAERDGGDAEPDRRVLVALVARLGSAEPDAAPTIAEVEDNRRDLAELGRNGAPVGRCSTSSPAAEDDGGIWLTKGAMCGGRRKG